jgi:hypothetical protein
MDYGSPRGDPSNATACRDHPSSNLLLQRLDWGAIVINFERFRRFCIGCSGT